MKIKVVVLSCLTAAIVLSLVHVPGWAKTKSEKTRLKIGVVSIRRIFKDCKKNVQYRQQATLEQQRVIAELEKSSKEIEAERAGLKTLKQGSNDYMARVKTILEKQAGLQAQQEFHKQQIELKDQRWTEELYKDILQQTDKTARQRGLDLVFEKDQIDFPAASANELMLTIRTHKLLYSGGCLDITDEVMAKLDAGN